MAQISFDQINFNTGSSNNQNQVGFFNLKNDRDEAVVRFMYDDVSQFEILTLHDVQINGKYRKVSCLSGPYEPVDKCPMCAAGQQTKQRFFVRMIQYTKNPDGTVTAEPKVWERSVQYALKLKGYLDNYGPLSDMVCKVIRHGAAGNMQTDYEIIPNLSKQMYPDNVFVKDNTPFENYHALGTIVMQKTPEEMQTFLTTGNFPAPQRQQNNQQATNMEQRATYQESQDAAMLNNMIQQTAQPAPTQQMPWQQPQQSAPQQSTQMPWQTGGNFNAAATTPARQQMPWETASAANRPNRSF